jgi:hypothetical protein
MCVNACDDQQMSTYADKDVVCELLSWRVCGNRCVMMRAFADTTSLELVVTVRAPYTCATHTHRCPQLLSRTNLMLILK